MAVSIADLRALVGAGTTHDTALTQCLAFGQQIVDTYTARVPVGKIPTVVLDEAVLTAAADQFHRRKAPNGVLNQAFTTADGTPVPVRIGRDPFSAIKPILRPWVGGSGLQMISLSGGEE